MIPRIAVHGGVGNGEKKQQFIDNQVIPKCNKIMEDGGTAVDAVESAINIMEKNKMFNAGRGSYLQLDGEPRPDAGIMNDDLEYGAVANISNILNPISVARDVMEQSPNPFIAGEYATKFALQNGYECKNLKTDDTLNKWKNKVEDVNGFEDRLEKGSSGSGTVGAVAIDKNGNMCAGTSTGGTPSMIEGRVGDSPIIGCGYYCNGEVAVSVTGDGAEIMKKQLSKEVANNYNTSIKDAVDSTIEDFESTVGLVAIDCEGDVYYQSTDGMTCGYSV